MTSILLIRPSALGDVCRTVPVLVSLRKAYPDARIDWLVRDSFADAVRSHPALSTCIPLQRHALSKQLKHFRFIPFFQMMRDLRSRRYDIAIDCQGLFRSGFFTWATLAPRRIGLANARELGWIWLNEKHHVGWEFHAVDRMLKLIEAAGLPPVRDMRLYTSPENRDAIATDPLLSGHRFAVIAPASRWPGKRWPATRFAEVIRWLLSNGRNDKVVLVGSRDERRDIQPLLALSQSDPRVIDRVGATTVGQLMALVESSSLVLGNDSAAIHMAVGFDRPAIGLYGATGIHEDGPYTGHNPACPVVTIQHLNPGEQINHRRSAAEAAALMERITVEEVQSAVSGLPSPSCLSAPMPSILPATRSSSQTPA